MDDIAPALLEKIRDDFYKNIKKNSNAAQILKQIKDGTATYAKAGDYAYEIGAALADAFGANLSSEILPDGKMYFNIADKIIAPMLEDDYALVSTAAVQVQQALNAAAGIGLKAQTAPLDTEGINNIVNKVAASPRYDNVAWMLNEPIKTFSQAVADNTLKHNVEFQSKAGLHPKIIRKAESKCCKWCSKLEGSYRYPEDIPDDVFRRHNRCRCTVDYDAGTGTGLRQNAWSKKWTTPKERDKLEIRKSIKPQENLHKAAYNEQLDIIKKYGNSENLMLNGSGEELSRWSDLQKITGKGQTEILKDLQADTSSWKSLLNAQTDAFRSQLSKNTLSVISEDEKTALRMWTGPAHGNINAVKRLGAPKDGITAENIKLMDAAFEKTTLNTDVYVHRGNDRSGMLKFLNGVDGWEEDVTKAIGKTVSDKGYFATSPDINGGFGGGYKMYIHIPQGTHGAYIADISHADNEKELLLQAGQKFVIRDAKKEVNSYGFEEPTFWLELIK